MKLNLKFAQISFSGFFNTMWVAVSTLLLINSILLVYTTHKPERNTRFLVDLRQFLENSRTADPEYFKIASAKNPKANPEENSGYFQGDIILTRNQINNIINVYSSNRNAVKNTDLLWPNKSLIYELHDNFDEEQRSAILNAFDEIQNKTCIKIRQRRYFDKHYLAIMGRKGGCYSKVGYAFNALEKFSYQVLNLAKNKTGYGCFRNGTIIHELLHTLGIHHMQSTFNRDHHVFIVRKNIIQGMEHNFLKYTPDDVTNLNVPYDYESVMHYGPYAFSASGEATIIPYSKKKVYMGQRDKAQDSDWLRVNRLYNCKGT